MVLFLIYFEVRTNNIYWTVGRDVRKSKIALRFGAKATQNEMEESTFWGKGGSCPGCGLEVAAKSKACACLWDQGRREGLEESKSQQRRTLQRKQCSQREVRRA